MRQELAGTVKAQAMTPTSVAFTYSSYVEMILSLDVLCDSGRHGVLLPWVVRFKERISPEVYGHVFDYAAALGGWTRAIEPIIAAGQLKELSVPSVLGELAAWRPGRFSAALAADGKRWTGFVGFLTDYWTDYFHEEFYWIEPLLASSVRRQVSEARDGGEPFLRGLAPQVAAALSPRWGEGIQVRMLPSVFCVDDGVLGEAGGMVLGCYPVAPGIYRRPESLTPPDPLARLLKTLADETRLKLLKLMLEEHRCTKDLAADLGLAEPTVSRHLRRLRDADLVEATEDGNFIYYTAKLERIAQLHMKVLDFLRS